MFFQRHPAAGLALALAAAASPVHAALQGRDADGNAATFEAYYDTDLHITWWADADVSGTGTTYSWVGANAFAAAQTLGGKTGWRLPTVAPANGLAFAYGGDYGTDGSKDFGYNITRETSELSHLFYVTLGLPGASANSPTFDPQDAYGDLNPSDDIDQGGVLLRNVGTKEFWYGTAADDGKTSCTPGGPFGGCAWTFNFYLGLQDYQSIDSPAVGPSRASAWLVHDGDVFAATSAVPEPTSVAMMLAGLGLLGGTARRRARQG